MLDNKTKQELSRLIANQAFDEAIKDGTLSEKEGDSNFVGDYMYMGQKDGRDQFKNIITRKYL